MLIDTHVLLWTLTDDDRLPAAARTTMMRATERLVSAASIWEIAIKASLGKLRAPDDLLERVASSGLDILDISAAHAWASSTIAGLPHRDPFDRLLLAQAATEGVPFMTADATILSAAIEPSVTLLDAR